MCTSLCLSEQPFFLRKRNQTWSHGKAQEYRWSSSGFKQLLEGGTDLLDHVRGGGGTAVLVKGLIIALPGQWGSTESSHQRGVHTGETNMHNISEICVCMIQKMIKCQAYPSVAFSDELRAQWEKTPREPDSRSPCPPQRRPLPSWLHVITRDSRRQKKLINKNKHLWRLKEKEKKGSLLGLNQLTLVAVSDDVLLSFQKQSHITKCNAQLLSCDPEVSAVQGLMVLKSIMWNLANILEACSLFSSIG